MTTTEITAAYFINETRDSNDFFVGPFSIPAEPAASHVRVEVHAAALNPADWKRACGAVGQMSREEHPGHIGLDVAGVVTKIGSNVTQFKPGDKVYGLLNHNNAVGSVATHVDAAEHDLALKPQQLSFAEAAAIPLAGLTALQALKKAGLGEGKNVFINAGAGGVGSFALQLARLYFKANKIATTVSTSKVALAKKLGATEIVDYTKEDFTKVLSAEYEAALDSVGDIENIAKIVKRNPDSPSRIISIVEIPDRETYCEGVETTFNVTIPGSENLERVFNKLVDEGKLQVLIDSTHEFTQDGVRRAIARLLEGRATGKIVITVKGD
ncbi:hypothetical protein EV182_004404 [Spiromyces aspiralis]|uniref:Uncharacterized protein n=1 Tax=Spiromyces aspiralis TaxID=68401 RepID=A0ACC1HIY0_9FUNG|nr:hypothetical protein EV182_004404 [Spiromyces aspiralis]